MANASSREKPYISVNKLGEYLVAPPRRRRRIVIDQKSPSIFKVARYTEALNAIVEYLASPLRKEVILTSAVDRLIAAKPNSEWEEQRNQLCIEAIESFMDLAPNLELGGFKVKQGPKDPPDLPISGVAVSVRPELLLLLKRKKSEIGAVKLYFSKTIAHSEESAAYVATTVQQYLNTHYSKLGRANPDSCVVVDVFAGELYTAPTAFNPNYARVDEKA